MQTLPTLANYLNEYLSRDDVRFNLAELPIARQAELTARAIDEIGAEERVATKWSRTPQEQKLRCIELTIHGVLNELFETRF